MTDEEMQATRREAERLKALPREVQRRVIDIHLAKASDAKAAMADRQLAFERAKVLARSLGMPTAVAHVRDPSLEP